MPLIKERLKHNDFNILDYIQTQTDDFIKTPFNEVDSVIFAQFAYLYFDRFISTTAQDKQWQPISCLYKAEEFDYMLHDTLYFNDNKRLLASLCASARYRDVMMNYYDSKFDVKTQEQFCAVSFMLPTKEVVVSFRGTDSTVIGWKEDFNMLYLSPVPSQISAVNYLETVAEKTGANIYVTGHSKGGNLAVYSALFCKKEIRDKIIRVYDLDGPGFDSHIWQDHNEEVEQIKEKITKIMPEGSFVGVLLYNQIQPKPIKSSSIGMLQHETYTWQINENEFVSTQSMSTHVKNIDKTIDTMLSELSTEQRKLVVETVFSVIEKTNALRLNDFIPLLIKEKDAIIGAIGEIDSETASFVKEVFMQMIKGYLLPNHKKADDKKVEDKKVDGKTPFAIFERGLRSFLGDSKNKEETEIATDIAEQISDQEI